MKRRVWRIFAPIPAVGVALMSHVAICPACWPLVGGLISALGVTTLIEGRFMLPVFVGSLLLAITPLGLEARRHIGPFSLGLVACVLIWSGRLVFDAAAITFGGIGILAGAYGWAYFLRGKNGAASCCSTCEVPESTAAGSTLTAEESVRTGVPIACALDKNQFAERKALLDRLAQAAAERKSIPNGCGFRFGSERGLVSQLASFIELERACCPFLSFRIDVKAGGTVWLELTGPVAAQEIIRELIEVPSNLGRTVSRTMPK